jgi:aminopeptidase N
MYKGEPGAPEKASLEDFIALVNQKKDLKWFFDEWVYKPGLPAYALLNPSISYRNGEYRIDVDIVQKGEIYKMPVEIKVGKNIETFWVDSPVERVRIYSDSLPSKLILDPNWKIPRYDGEVWLNLTDG